MMIPVQFGFSVIRLDLNWMCYAEWRSGSRYRDSREDETPSESCGILFSFIYEIN